MGSSSGSCSSRNSSRSGVRHCNKLIELLLQILMPLTQRRRNLPRDLVSIYQLHLFKRTNCGFSLKKWNITCRGLRIMLVKYATKNLKCNCIVNRLFLLWQMIIISIKNKSGIYILETCSYDSECVLQQFRRKIFVYLVHEFSRWKILFMYSEDIYKWLYLEIFALLWYYAAKVSFTM